MLTVLSIPCVHRARDAASPSLPSRSQGGGLPPGRGQAQADVAEVGVSGSSELISSLPLTRIDVPLLLSCLAGGFAPEGWPQTLPGALADAPHP